MRIGAQAAVAVGLTAPAGVAATSQSAAGAAMAQIATPPNPLLAGLATLCEAAVGEYAGTGAAQDVVLPFDPLCVIISAVDATLPCISICFATTDGQAIAKSAKAQKTNGVDLIGAQGVVCGTAGQRKFTLGTDAAVNENAKKYSYIAFGV